MFAKLIIYDEVNIKFENIDVKTRRQMSAATKFMLPYAYFMPAYKLGRWDGMIRFCDIGGRTYLNLLDILLPIIQKAGYELQIDDRRQQWNFSFSDIDKNYLKDIKWPKGHTCEGEPIVLREHQVDCINKFLSNVQSLQQIPTAAGKTILITALSKQVEKYGRSIIIVPNKDLVSQTEEDYKNIGLDVGVFYGDRKEFNHQHTICTWQSLNILEKKGKDYINEFIKDVVCVIVDEAHAIKGDILKKLLTGVFASVPIRWGLTGTLPKEDHEFFNLKISIGEVVNVIPAIDLQNEGVLSNCEVKILQLKDGTAYSNYMSELKYLVSDNKRIDYITEIIDKISKDGNTLVLIGRIKTGDMLVERLPNAIFVKGAIKSEKRKETYDSVATKNDCLIVATYGVASVGINLPRLHNIVFLEPGKSFIRVMQSLGRGLRKTADKNFINIIDICSDCKYSKRHLTLRKSYYSDAKFPFTVEKITYKG